MYRRTIKKYFISFVITITLMALVLTGCHANDWQEFTFTAEPGVGDKTGFCNEMAEACLKPEVLASTLSAFPSLITRLKIPVSDPIELEKYLENLAQDHRELILIGLWGMLEDEGTTEIMFGKTSGDSDMLGMEMIDEDGPLDSSNHRLVWVKRRFDEALQVRVTYFVDDETEEVGYFDLERGFNRCVPAPKP